MSNPSVEQLENIISTYINTVFKDAPPTEEDFNEKAAMLRESNEKLMPVTDEEFNNILIRLRQTCEIKMDIGVYINDQNNGHQSWLPAKRADFDFFFWNRYKRYLEEMKHWNPRVTSNLGRVSDEILDLCGNPAEDHFAIKGLVLGDVQSGNDQRGGRLRGGRGLPLPARRAQNPPVPDHHRALSGPHVYLAHPDLHRICRPGSSARNRPLQRHFSLKIQKTCLISAAALTCPLILPYN